MLAVPVKAMAVKPGQLQSKARVPPLSVAASQRKPSFHLLPRHGGWLNDRKCETRMYVESSGLSGFRRTQSTQGASL